MVHPRTGLDVRVAYVFEQLRLSQHPQRAVLALDPDRCSQGTMRVLHLLGPLERPVVMNYKIMFT